MIWAVAVLTMAVVILDVAVLCTLRVVWLSKAPHAKCIAHIAAVVSNRVVAMALRQAADRYDSMDGQAELTRIRNGFQRLNSAPSASIPALWIREEADRIEAGA